MSIVRKNWNRKGNISLTFPQYSPHRLVLETTVRDLHLVLSEATRGAVSIVRPRFFRSCWTVCLKVSVPFSSGCPSKTKLGLGSESEGMRRTCPKQHQHLVWMVSAMDYTLFGCVAVRLRWYWAKRSWGFVEGIYFERLSFFSVATEDFQHSDS